MPVVAVFSLPPAQRFAETVVGDQTGTIIADSLIDLPQSAEAIPRPGASEGPIHEMSQELEWLASAVSPRLGCDHRFWICLEADGHCVGGVVWGGGRDEKQRLSPQAHEISVIASGWGLALRTAQIREEARTLSEQLAESNRQLQNAQAEILRSKTMITVGEMAAGAAHEMNNPLAVISGRSQLLAAQLSDPKLKSAASLISEQSHRLSGIITELMDFARPQPPVVREAELTDVVEQAICQAKGRADPADRQIEVAIGQVPRVQIDPLQVAAALAEVIENALHASDRTRGRIEIQAAHDPHSSRVVVTVSDNGCGMDEHILRCAFDPFFSAKPAGRRRGLGLAKALRWIEASGGSIRLESRPGQGTLAIVLLPQAASAVSVAQESEPRKVAES